MCLFDCWDEWLLECQGPRHVHQVIRQEMASANMTGVLQQYCAQAIAQDVDCPCRQRIRHHNASNVAPACVAPVVGCRATSVFQCQHKPQDSPAAVACSAATVPCVSASCSRKASTGSNAVFATAAAIAASLAAACAAASPRCSSSSCC